MSRPSEGLFRSMKRALVQPHADDLHRERESDPWKNGWMKSGAIISEHYLQNKYLLNVVKFSSAISPK